MTDRCTKCGEHEPAPNKRQCNAIYRVHIREGSRNAPSDVMNETYRRIRKQCPPL